jgi:lipoprotein signal peptidase
MVQRTAVAVPETPIPPAPESRGGVKRIGELPQAVVVFVLLAAIVALDQAFKWWAWRHASTVMINRGGNALVPAAVDQWYADPVTGALLDLMDVGLLGFAVSILALRRRSTAVLMPGAVMLGGWSSNLLDRLGMHFWTAPGSIRGAVDFIHLGWINVNVADVFIVVGTPLFVLAVSSSFLGGWGTKGPAATSSVTDATARRRARRWIRAIALTGGVGVVAVVGVGATNYGGVTAPNASATSPARSLR